MLAVDGILNLDKPYGMTSMDVVRRIKRASRAKRVGHGGTLDPVATGVIPICFGRATRIMEYLVSGTKDYGAVVEFGATTDTYDAMGKVTARSDASHLTAGEIEGALQSFKGEIDQVPPMFSALKQKGKRLYDLARAGIEVEREPRRVEVLSIELADWSYPLAKIEVRCGRGFYMRSLAHDLGQALGCGAHLKNLVRQRSGPFELSSASSLEDAEQLFADNLWRTALHPADVVLQDLRAMIVGTRIENSLRHGGSIPSDWRAPPGKAGERCRAYGVGGKFLAVLSFDAPAGQWRADKVFLTG
jgi:tRNA pseudouridine55 synthase